MKYKFIQRESSLFRVEKMCQLFEVKRSQYYAWLKCPQSNTAYDNEIITEKIKKIHGQKGKSNYGSPRMASELRDLGFICSTPRVARLMKEANIVAKRHKKFKVTTNSKHEKLISPNILQQIFRVEKPNERWVSDITYIRTGEGWLYLTTVIDLFHRGVVGWSMSDRMYAQQTTEAALKHAYKRTAIQAKLIFHSDKGIQYACSEFRKLLKDNGMIQSMSGRGNCYDNAVAESFFKTLKAELIYQNDYRTRKEAKTAIFEYIETFYNKERRHSTLGNISPQQYLDNYYLDQENQLCFVA
jgi:transposase InsO family protein